MRVGFHSLNQNVIKIRCISKAGETMILSEQPPQSALTPMNESKINLGIGDTSLNSSAPPHSLNSNNVASAKL